MTSQPSIAVGDPIVIDHEKHHVTSLGGEPGKFIYAKMRGQPAERMVRRDALVWDRVAGLWRLPCTGCPRCIPLTAAIP